MTGPSAQLLRAHTCGSLRASPAVARGGQMADRTRAAAARIGRTQQRERRHCGSKFKIGILTLHCRPRYNVRTFKSSRTD